MAMFIINPGTTSERQVEADYWEFEDEYILFYRRLDGTDRETVYAIKKSSVGIVKKSD